MAETKQNLPFRPLEVRGHGVWDPERKAFYPFKSAETLTGKQNIRYFVHSCTLSGRNEGDRAASQLTTVGYIFGKSSIFCIINIPTTVAASNINAASVSFSSTLDVLCDVNRNIGVAASPASPTTYKSTIIYAEIPDDISGQ